jgi:hypothetical protein
MKALVLKRYAKSNNIGFADIPRPILKANEILVPGASSGAEPNRQHDSQRIIQADHSIAIAVGAW